MVVISVFVMVTRLMWFESWVSEVLMFISVVIVGVSSDM